MALPRPAWMSMPEWPPLRPKTFRRKALVPARRGRAGELAGDDGVLAAGAADGEVALLLAVEVEEELGLEAARLEAVGAREAGLLVNGDQGLEGAVGDVLAGQHRQGRGHADAVVGAEGGARGPEEVAVTQHLDGVLEEVVDRVLVLLADHVHMGLEQTVGRPSLPGGGRLADDDVADLVLLHLAAQGPGLIGHPGGGLGFVLGAPGDLRQLQEVGPERLRFEGFEQGVHKTSLGPAGRPGRFRQLSPATRPPGT